MADGALDDVDRELSDLPIDPTYLSLAAVGENKWLYKWSDDRICMDIENQWKKQTESMNDEELRRWAEEENRKRMVAYIRWLLDTKREITGDVFERLHHRLNFREGEGKIYIIPALLYVGDLLDSIRGTDVKLIAENNETNLTFDEPHISKRRVWEMSLPYYLAVHKRYKLLLALLKRVPELAPRDDVRVRLGLAGGIEHSSIIERSIRPIIEHAACLDPNNEVLRKILWLLFEQAAQNKLQLAEHFVLSEKFIMYLIAEGKCPEYKTYIKTYFDLLKQTDKAVASTCVESSRDKWGLQKHCIHWLLDYCVYKNKAESLRVVLDIILQSNIVSKPELIEIIAEPYESKLTNYRLNTTVAERCLFGAVNDASICEVVFDTLEEKDEIEKIFARERGTWLLTKIAKKESEEVVKLILDYNISLDEEYQQQLHEKLVEGSLSQNMICLMNNLADNYIIPQGETGAQKHALVYYNVIGRQNGGEDEAETVLIGLDKLGFQVQHRQDWTAADLHEAMGKDIDEVKNDCSVLVVFLMAHGGDDEVDGIDRKPIDITELDYLINSRIPEGIPKIFIVETCRRQSLRISVNIPRDPVNSEHFGRFMSAAKGETSIRNVMIPILMEELQKMEKESFLKMWDTVRKRVKAETTRIKQAEQEERVKRKEVIKDKLDRVKEEAERSEGKVKELEEQMEGAEDKMERVKKEGERSEGEMKELEEQMKGLKDEMDRVIEERERSEGEMKELEEQVEREEEKMRIGEQPENTLTVEGLTLYSRPIRLRKKSTNS